MKKINTAVVVAALAVSLASCRTADDVPSASDISDGLMSVTDLGTDWRETQRDVFDERTVENPVLDRGAFCPDSGLGVAELDDLAGQAGADVEFQKKDGSSAIRLQAWSNSDAVEFNDAVAGAAAMCDGASWTDEFGTESTFAVVEGPDLGDGSVHWSSTATPSGEMGDKMTSTGRTSVVRFDDVVFILQWGDFGAAGAGGGIDVTRWAEVVGIAYERLSDAL